MPRYSVKEDIQKLKKQKLCQQWYYNHHGKDLQPIAPGETVKMCLPGKNTWSVGICKAL